MLKVKNRKVITSIAKSSFKANKMRNIFAIIAIILTTVMFTTLFTVGMSMKTCMEDSTMRQVGGSAHGSFKYLNKEQFDKLKTHKLIKEIEISIILGFAENKELNKTPSEIRYATNRQAELFFSKPTVGYMPTKYNEVALNTKVLDAFGLPYELGQSITLEYLFNGEKVKDTFILSGYWVGDNVSPANQIFISKEYLDKRLETLDKDLNEKYIGSINADVNFKNSLNIEKKLQKILIDSGLSPVDIAYGVNWAYISNSGDIGLGTVFAVIGGILLIIFCGYLIIYNIFYISVSSDIRFYGLLKTVGTTRKQIGKIIRRQAMMLCIIGIPIGLIQGYLIGVKMTPIVLAQLEFVNIKLSASPIIFIFAAIFAFITVMISTRKPAKLAGKVSPIEALRNTETDANIKKKLKKSQGVNVRTMALSNVFRSKKKTLLVIISLSLSLIILTCTSTIVKSFDMDTFLKNEVISDFVVADAEYFSVYVGYNGQETLTEEVLNTLGNIEGIENSGNIRFAENFIEADDYLINRIKDIVDFYKDGFMKYQLDAAERILSDRMYTQHIYGIDEFILEKLELFEGEFDYEKFKSGKYIISSAFDSSGNHPYYNVGDKVNIDFGNGNVVEYEVMANASMPHNISVRHGHFFDPNLFLSTDEFITQAGELAPMLTVFDTEDAYENSIDEFLSNYCNNINKSLDYQSKKLFVDEFKSIQNTYRSVGFILSFVVAFIGVMNFINTMITSVITRRRELAMLQSIGMTKKQLNKMLIWEGIIYAVLTTVFVMTIGLLISYVGTYMFAGSIWFFKFKFSVLPVVLCLPILYVIAIIVPVFCSKTLNKETIIERLREVE